MINLPTPETAGEQLPFRHKLLLGGLTAMAALIPAADAAASVDDPEFTIIHKNRLHWTCEPHTVYFPPSENRDDWVRALEVFDKASAHRWVLTDQAETAEVKVILQDPEGPAAASVDLWADDVYYRQADIWWDPILPADEQKWFTTMLHELGHVAGIGHVVDFEHVMSTWVQRPFMRYQPGDLLGIGFMGRDCARAEARADAWAKAQPQTRKFGTLDRKVLKRYTISEHDGETTAHTSSPNRAVRRSSQSGGVELIGEGVRSVIGHHQGRNGSVGRHGFDQAAPHQRRAHSHR